MNQDDKWQKLMAQAAPTFDGDKAPPYGFVTATMAGLRAEKRQQDEAERIGWRALWASFAALVVIAGISLTVNFSEPGGDFDPGVRGLVQMENIQLS